MKRNKKK